MERQIVQLAVTPMISCARSRGLDRHLHPAPCWWCFPGVVANAACRDPGKGAAMWQPWHMLIHLYRKSHLVVTSTLYVTRINRIL